MMTGSFPWERASWDSSLFREHAAGHFQWSPVLPEPCVRLLEGMLAVDPSRRLTLDQVQAHPWLQGDQATCEHHETVCDHQEVPHCHEEAQHCSAVGHEDRASPATVQQDDETAEVNVCEDCQHLESDVTEAVCEIAVVEPEHIEVTPTMSAQQQLESPPAPVQQQCTPQPRRRVPHCAAVDTSVPWSAKERLVHEVHAVPGDASPLGLGALMALVMLGAAAVAAAAEVSTGDGIVVPLPTLGIPHITVSAAFLGVSMAIAGLVPFVLSLCHLFVITNSNMEAMTKRLCHTGRGGWHELDAVV